MAFLGSSDRAAPGLLGMCLTIFYTALRLTVNEKTGFGLGFTVSVDGDILKADLSKRGVQYKQGTYIHSSVE